MNLKEQIMAVIDEHGFDELKKVIVPDFLKMVAGTKIKKQFGTRIFATGYSHYTPDGLEAAIECLLEVMPKDEETENLRTSYGYFKENKEEILLDHNITP